MAFRYDYAAQTAGWNNTEKDGYKQVISQYVADLKDEFRGYGPKPLVQDIMAGLTVAAVALPLALAFGVSSGATAAAGLLTAIVAGCIIALLGGAFYQISGPTGAMAAILISVVAQYGMQGVFLATAMAGILLILAGALKLGRLTAFIPMPVITGFTSGIAVIIAFGQIDHFFGVTSSGTSVVEKTISYVQNGFSPDWVAVAIGAAVILLMVLYPKRWNGVVPGSLVAIVLATAACMLFSVDVPSVGAIPKSLLLDERLHFSGISLSQLTGLLAPAVSIAALGMVESLLCGASASRMTNVRLNSDRELVAQGIGNLLAPFFGGIPATAAIARTSVAVKSGAKTRLTGVFHAIFLLVSMLALAPVMSRIPLSALAGVLMVTAWRMNEWSSIRYMFSKGFKSAICKFLVTMLATVFLDLTAAIIIGVVLALIFLAVRLSRLEINYDRVDPGRLRDRDSALASRVENAMVIYISGPIIFANTQLIEDIAEHTEGCKTLLFSMRGVPQMDISGAQTLLDLLKRFQKDGCEVFLCGVPASSMEMVKRSGIEDLLGEKQFYWSVERALLDEEPAPQKTFA